MIRKIFCILTMVSLSASFAGYLFSEEPEGFTYESKGKRDPFIPLITQETRVAAGLENVQTIDDIVLEGIVWDAQGDSITILNGVIMKEGQGVGNVKIKKIDEKKVTLFINEMEYQINLIKKGDEFGGEE